MDEEIQTDDHFGHRDDFGKVSTPHQMIMWVHQGCLNSGFFGRLLNCLANATAEKARMTQKPKRLTILKFQVDARRREVEAQQINIFRTQGGLLPERHFGDAGIRIV